MRGINSLNDVSDNGNILYDILVFWIEFIPYVLLIVVFDWLFVGRCI